MMEPFSMFASQRRAIILNKHNYCSQSRFTRTEKNGIEIALYGIMKSGESEHYELLQLERSILFSRPFFSFFFSNLLVKIKTKTNNREKAKAGKKSHKLRKFEDSMFTKGWEVYNWFLSIMQEHLFKHDSPAVIRPCYDKFKHIFP